MKRFEDLKGTAKVVRLDHAFVAFSGDVITRICTHEPRDLVDEESFSPKW